MTRSGSSFRRLLRPLSLLYGAGERRERERKARREYRSSLPVISVGNLTVGGSGKTPLILYLIRHLQSHYPLLVMSRGYRRKGSAPLLWRAGDSIPDPELLGDEPALIASILENGAIGIAADRGRFLRSIEDEFTGSVALLDDGFQHHGLARDLDIVIVDDRTCEHPHLLPEGDLREAPSALRRAGVVMATSEAAREFAVRWKSEESELFDLRFRSNGINRWNGGAPLPPGARPLLVTGVARAERVIVSLRELGVEPLEHLSYRDHHRYNRDDIRSMLAELKRIGGSYIVTTGKDAVKLQAFAELSDLIYVVDHEAVVPDDRRLFQRLVEAIRIGGKRNELKNH